ncbi:MAG TPA: 5-methyltetrahydropteroyltriglutamate--homocysteine S-methyltransferase [Puia sp.]|nr:5-methyltetrahydropteroyltriglutamate--homocysteine S-methyltransferase [Puia sp.]
MQTHNLGYPRIGSNRELKKANEQFWQGKITQQQLSHAGKEIRKSNWRLQQAAGIDWIPSNDFSFYDQVLDMTLTVGAIPERYQDILLKETRSDLDLYFAMARGYQEGTIDVPAMEMTKWFDTNYHYIVPEFYRQQSFKLLSNKIVHEFIEAKQEGLITKPVIIGPVSYLLLGKEKEPGFHRLELLDQLLPVYFDILTALEEQNAPWVQFDEPFLAMGLDPQARSAFEKAYEAIRRKFPRLKFILGTYFEALQDNLALAVSLSPCVLHVDLARAPGQLEEVLAALRPKPGISLSLGVIDGRNVWKNELEKSLTLIQTAIGQLGMERVWIAPSCSLLHSPCDLDLEPITTSLSPTIKSWMAFARQKIGELATLKQLITEDTPEEATRALQENQQVFAARRQSQLIHQPSVQVSVKEIRDSFLHRQNGYPVRKELQSKSLRLPLFPTTTIGSFPQTKEVRAARAKWKSGEMTAAAYDQYIREQIRAVVQWQEQINIDVLVHGEFERNDMVEFFGEQLDGFAFTSNGWVQSYGSRCVKPPVIYGDVRRKKAMTVEYTAYAQSLTARWVKGMLTGPVTILQWSFVRDDQPRKDTCWQIALAIRDEVTDLEKAGIRIIQIDEPAIREGLPLRKEKWNEYLQWAVDAFKISSSNVADTTQIHTHMCYSEFNDILQAIADMDADVITIETSRSQMELLHAFHDFKYPNDIGPGVYDIHSPRIPSKEEILLLLEKAGEVIPAENLWVNPDCGLKTRAWPETRTALIAMTEAAAEMRSRVTQVTQSPSGIAATSAPGTTGQK